MTQDEASQLERDFGISFPNTYREAITDFYPFNAATEELDTGAGSLRTENEDCRKTDPWGFPWEPSFWRIGGDGAGGFYFIDTREGDSTVYYCDHEIMPRSMDDRERLYVTPFQEFVEEVRQVEEEMGVWEKEMKERVAHRKWWQFWVPRQWPPGSKGAG